LLEILIALIMLASPVLILVSLVKLASKGPVLYWSDRIGRDNVIFIKPKFRTMSEATPEVATHHHQNPDKFPTPIFNFLSNDPLDELPRIFSILKGDMGLVGPRPASFTQDDLIATRSEKGIYKLTLGFCRLGARSFEGDLGHEKQIGGRDGFP
jgi:O-antigen biosynthesis protein WbqP